jgi:Tfp pilus assembly protein PilN
MTDTFAPAAARFATIAGAPESAPRRGLLASLFAALSEDDTASYRFLLLLRFLVLNLVAASLLGAAWLKGWVAAVFTGDSTQLVLVITIVFAFGLASCARKIFLTSTEINQLKEPAHHRSARVTRYFEAMQGRDGHSRALAASALRLKLGARIASIRHLANSLVFLGLIGTVIGFIIALSGIDPDAAGDVDSIGPMVSTLISGMSVALYTTLVGAILNIWLMVNYRLLESGTVTLVTTVVELGDRHARP